MDGPPGGDENPVFSRDGTSVLGKSKEDLDGAAGEEMIESVGGEREKELSMRGRLRWGIEELQGRD